MSLARYGAQRRRAGCLNWAVLAGLGVLVGLGLALFLALPRLTAFAPAAGAPQVSSLAPVRLTFNLPMDAAAVEAAFTITPLQPGRLTWDGNTLVFTPDEPWPAGGTVTVTLAGGRSRRGLPLLGTRTWTFTVGEPRLAYLTGSPANLWVEALGPDAVPQQITNEPNGVYNYAISPDGAQFIYAVYRPDGGADLRRVNVDGTGAAELLACPGEGCVSPVISPDGRYLAYQRHALVAGLTESVNLGPSQVYVLDLANGDNRLISDAEASLPRWGPDGRLAYLDTSRAAVAIHDLASGAVTYVPNAWGEPATWSPDGTALVFRELVFPDEPAHDPAEPEEEHSERFFSYLVRVTVATNETVNLSGDSLVEDASPVFAPSGAWLAFGRKSALAGDWTPGQQLWLMRPDGSQARPLLSDPLYNYSAFRWSPDSARLAYMRLNAVDLFEPAEIWVVNVQASGEPGPEGPRLVAAGFLPEWLP